MLGKLYTALAEDVQPARCFNPRHGIRAENGAYFNAVLRQAKVPAALHVFDALLSGTHEAGTSHYELLRAFVDDAGLAKMDAELASHDYLTHEFGDSVLVERASVRAVEERWWHRLVSA